MLGKAESENLAPHTIRFQAQATVTQKKLLPCLLDFLDPSTRLLEMQKKYTHNSLDQAQGRALLFDTPHDGVADSPIL